MKRPNVFLSLDKDRLRLHYGQPYAPNTSVDISPVFEFMQSMFAHAFLTGKPEGQDWPDYLLSQITFDPNDAAKPSGVTNLAENR